jgi:formylmethanofuran dehydrogenase subunit C
VTIPRHSDRLTLTLREPSPVPLELDGVTPEAVARLSLLEVAKLPVYHGNRREELGQFFDVTGDPSRGWIQFAGDTRTVKGIGAGMGSGTVYVENDAGMHAGARMAGGMLVIDSGAGDWLGAEMSGGVIEVRHSAGNQVGAAYRGSRRGMTGGVIWCRNNAGDEVGLLMRRGLIVVEGNCGEFAGASMIAGSLFVGGTAGGRLGAGMKRGTIFAGTVTELPPSFRYSCEFRPSVLAVYRKHLAALGCDLPGLGAEVVRCYRGDLLYGGRGEVFMGSPPQRGGG